MELSEHERGAAQLQLLRLVLSQLQTPHAAVSATGTSRCDFCASCRRMPSRRRWQREVSQLQIRHGCAMDKSLIRHGQPLIR
jgi:hypothetical protein